jgi:metallophosphoesterase (TIGR00282 family)
VVVANGENVAGGLGITPRLAKELLRSGVEVITTGNHLFRRQEIVPYIENTPILLRPHNFRTRAPGKGWVVHTTSSGARIGIFNLVGQLYMDPAGDPAIAADEILDGPLADVSIRMLDFHAEATGEKQGMMHYLDGRVAILVGTHTHVQTADEKVTQKGTAYISDAGMTGALDSVIGMDPKPVLDGIRTGLPQRYMPGKGDVELQGVIVDIDASTGRATSIERVREPLAEEPDG